MHARGSGGSVGRGISYGAGALALVDCDLRGQEVASGFAEVRQELLPRGRRAQVPVGRKGTELGILGGSQASLRCLN